MKVIFRFAAPARALKNCNFLVNLKVSFVAISVFHVLSDFSKANSLWEVELKSSITIHQWFPWQNMKKSDFSLLCKFSVVLGGVYMIPVRVSFWYEFIPVLRGCLHDTGTSSSRFLVIAL